MTFGTLSFAGYADGTFIRVSRSGDAFGKRKGAGGDVERINRNQGDFEVSLTLLQTSSTNQELSAILAADQVTNAGVFPLTIEEDEVFSGKRISQMLGLAYSPFKESLKITYDGLKNVYIR